MQLKSTSKIYKMGDQEVRALDDVSLDIFSGDYLAIIGPSGSGKSTLMHLLGCLDKPTSGQILLDGTDVGKASSAQLAALRCNKVGFVFQNYNLLSKLDVYQNVELPLLYGGVSRGERKKRISQALASVGLSDRIHHRPTQLSGGQCQRVAIARALVNRPRIILADEPTGALDSHNGALILNLFDELQKNGNTIALVTHDLHVASHAKKKIVMKDGKIDEVILNPKTLESGDDSCEIRDGEPQTGAER